MGEPNKVRPSELIDHHHLAAHMTFQHLLMGRGQRVDA